MLDRIIFKVAIPVIAMFLLASVVWVSNKNNELRDIIHLEVDTVNDLRTQLEIERFADDEPIYLFRESITEAIKTVESMDAVIDFYNEYVGDRELTILILSAAEVYTIPENVLMALIWAESNFKPGAVNGTGNKDGTNDKGLMQLNSRYFKGFDRLDPKLNLQYGCKHLRDRFQKYGSWDAAVMYYNGFSQKAVEHQARVLAKERELDRAFSTWRAKLGHEDMAVSSSR